jgi:hypothetical protein
MLGMHTAWHEYVKLHELLVGWHLLTESVHNCPEFDGAVVWLKW